MITSWETDDGTNTDDEDDDTPPHLVPPTKILMPGNNKLAIFQDVIINSNTATVMFDTGASGNGGNWITDSTANRLGTLLEPTKKRSWKSPLLTEAKFVSKTKTSLSILFTSFGFEIQHVEFRVMETVSMKADIILGLQFFEKYDIMSYLTNPDCYNAIHALLPADEESLDWEEGIHAFQSAILDLSSEAKESNIQEEHNYRTGENVLKKILRMKGPAPFWNFSTTKSSRKTSINLPLITHP